MRVQILFYFAYPRGHLYVRNEIEFILPELYERKLSFQLKLHLLFCPKNTEPSSNPNLLEDLVRVRNHFRLRESEVRLLIYFRNFAYIDMQNHTIICKPIMLFEKIKPPIICSETKLIIKELKDPFLVMIIITGPAADQLALPIDLPIPFKRNVKTSFALTSLKVIYIFGFGRIYLLKNNTKEKIYVKYIAKI